MEQSDLKDALLCLSRGEIVITPSESCYGFSCDAANARAVRNLHILKQERLDKPLTILVSSLEQMESIGHISQAARVLSNQFHPGPLNLIVLLKDHRLSHLAQNDAIAFRIPSDPTLLELVKQFGKPITTTSTNIHGHASLYLISDVRTQFENAVCTIIDVGDLDPNHGTSTIFDVQTMEIAREGPVSHEMIESVLHKNI